MSKYPVTAYTGGVIPQEGNIDYLYPVPTLVRKRFHLVEKKRQEKSIYEKIYSLSGLPTGWAPLLDDDESSITLPYLGRTLAAMKKEPISSW